MSIITLLLILGTQGDNISFTSTIGLVTCTKCKGGTLGLFTQAVLVRDKIRPYLTHTKIDRVNACFVPGPRVSTHLFSPAFEVGSGPGLSFIPY